MQNSLQRFHDRCCELSNLRHVSNVLGWDQGTYLPPGSSEARGDHLALINQIAHERLIDPQFGKLLEEMERTVAPSASPRDAALIRVMRREFDRAVRVPAEFVARRDGHFSRTYELWTKARPRNDFKSVEQALRTTLELSKEYSQFFKSSSELSSHPMDPLIDGSDPGMTVSMIRPLFKTLKDGLVPLVKKHCSRLEKPGPDQIDLHFLSSPVTDAVQIAFCREVASQIGYSFDTGRLDETTHPFMIRLGPKDVRITTRIKTDAFTECLFSVIHEAGHALYEQGIAEDYLGLPTGEGVSQGIHESQSRFWENMVGRSLDFWKYFYPILQKRVPDAFTGIPLETFYRGINRPQRSLIRTEADELTYNLHVMIRFELECQMLEGSLEISQLPKKWNDLYEEFLGIRPPDDRDGVLQDVHWYFGGIGGLFQGYTLGNLFAAQLHKTLRAKQPEIFSGIPRGDFTPLRDTLKTLIYQHGSSRLPQQIIRDSTGSDLSAEPLLEYLDSKFSGI